MSLLETAKAVVERLAGIDKPVEVVDGEKFFQAAIEDQKQYHARWYRNIAFLMGYHWLSWNEGSGTWTDPPKPSWRVRLTFNLIKPKVRTQVGNILRAEPQFAALPANDSEEARDGARVGNRFLEGIYFTDDMQRKLYRLTTWFVSVTSSFMWALYDPTAGRSWEDKEIGPDGNPVLDENGQPKTKRYYEGAVIHDTSSPFETLLEPGAPEDFNEHRRVMRIKVREVDYIRDKYGVEVPPEELTGETMFHLRVSGLLAAGKDKNASLKDRKVALVKEFFELPTTKYPNGRHFIYANGVVLVATEDLDYFYNGERAIPAAKFEEFPYPGCAWGGALPDDLIPLNECFNGMSSKVVENGNMHGRPKVLAPKGSLDEEVWTDEPGEVVEYTPIGSHKPEGFKPPEMPQYFFAMKDSIPPLIDRISMVPDYAEGRLPRRATSGRAIDALQEANDAALAPGIKNFASGLSRLFSITLNTVGRKYTEERLLQFVGRGHKAEVMRFKGAMLAGTQLVHVEMKPALSRAARTSLAMELAEKELIPGDMALKIMELGDLNALFDANSDHIQYAKVENMQMAKGIMVQPAPFERHKAHNEVHDQFLNSPEGRALPPEIQQIITQHMALHDQFMVQAAQAQMALGGATPEAPPSGGPA